MPKPSKIANILDDLKIIKKGDNNLLTNLIKPPKEKKKSMPTTTASEKFATEQVDTLFLPNDNGFKYCLVVVDIATRLMDAEPMKNKEAETTKKALEKIFKRKILKRPLRLEVDEGTEFKGAFKAFYDKVLEIRTKVAGRHRQQAVVETKNQVIGKIINQKLLADEIATGETATHWTEILPKVVQLINQNYAHEAEPTDPKAPIRSTGDIFPIGTKVRVALDNPVSYQGDKLHGKFRTGDLRWTKEIKTITQFYIRPNQPILYQVDNKNNVAYSKEQLQVVKADEVKPKSLEPEKYEIERLVRRFKENNKVVFEVKWKGYDKTTTEPRNLLMKDIPDLVKAFEKDDN